MSAHGLQQLAVIAVALVVGLPAPGQDGGVLQGGLLVDDQLRVELLQRAQAGASRAGAVRAVEAEGARLDFGQAGAALHAGEVFAEGPVVRGVAVGHVCDDKRAVA